ncbi:VWA domain-containing protein [Desulforhopalus singaporensis]|uniref:Ca-activated chloride channel family protein n=1 Tax=Desulforhopalus singaporensis TaxID=91360 RepID=A0A1H0S753_9BACT|nr:VWA domain-containing protein [Desulforhopalus singaporensis]SDP37369.1 Ca-activated chloride channel family protein [Desulforhopalus singaporensis]
MTFAQPLWLLAGIGVCLALALFFRSTRKKKEEALARFAAKGLLAQLTRNVSSRKRFCKNTLLVAALFCCFAALARPQYGYRWVEVKRKGIDLLFALDTSKSMLAEDIRPNRLKRAQLAILDFSQQLEGDRVGLLPFAGSAYLMCPLTLDYDAFEQSLNVVSTDLIPKSGTNIGAVIDKGIEVLNNDANHKILIILTDGENLEGDAVFAAKEAKRQGVTVYTVGVGTSAGELIPLGNGESGFAKDQDGNFIRSRLDETMLTAIAENTGGIYARLGKTGEGLATIYAQRLALIPKEELQERRHKVPLERFQYPLAAALIFFILEMLVGETRNRMRFPLLTGLKSKIFRKRFRANGSLIVIIAFATLFSGPKAYGSKGEEAYLRGDYLEASQYYLGRLKKAPDNPLLNYNFATSAYQNNMYDDAIEGFGKALIGDDLTIQQKAYYNRGNAYYRKGAETEKTEPQATIGLWSQAVDDFTAALKLDPDDSRTKSNLEFVKKRLEKLQKEQQQNNQQQQNGNGKDQRDGKTGRQDAGQKQQQHRPENGSDGSGENNRPATENQEKQAARDNPADYQNRQNDMAAGGTAPEGTTGDNGKKEEAVQSRQDTTRRKEGKMTKTEAQQLLKSLKHEEGELNFVPAENSMRDDQQGKDW